MNGGYQVIWKQSLIRIRLANLVVEAMQRGEDVAPITEAMSEIDRLLSTDPVHEGESRANFERVLIVDPLTVTYEVHEDEHLVYVLTLAYRAPRNN